MNEDKGGKKSAFSLQIRVCRLSQMAASHDCSSADEHSPPLCFLAGPILPFLSCPRGGGGWRFNEPGISHGAALCSAGRGREVGRRSGVREPAVFLSYRLQAERRPNQSPTVSFFRVFTGRSQTSAGTRRRASASRLPRLH